MKKYLIYTGLVAVLVVMIAITRDDAVEETVVPEASTQAAVGSAKEICYYYTKPGEFGTDQNFLSVNYDANGEVHGVINYFPEGASSVTGAYTGKVEDSNVPGYSSRLDVLYTGTVEGYTAREQDLILIGENDAKRARGEREEGGDGVFIFRSFDALEYPESWPKVDCSSINREIRADYSKV